ncbi:MAG: phosphoribosylglycinamide formyltransferase [Anaerovoracaceae bacterium]|nr:phosphoribosylglycinamide formyltransferase [Anaerovoracaceae bacterium]
MDDMRISVLASGGGTDFQSIIDAVESGQLKGVKIVQLIAGKDGIGAIDRAEKHGIKVKCITKNNYPDMDDRMKAVERALDEEDTDLVVLAGYLSIVAPSIIKKYDHRIINIHPALLPKHGGKDCYGINVHRMVLEAGDKESGATVHYVNEGIDTGEPIIQSHVPVLPDDTPESLAARVLETEHVILPQAIGMIAEKRGKA